MATVALLLVLLEGVGSVDHPEVPAPPVPLDQVAAPLYVVTAGPLDDAAVMLWSTDGFPEVVNGNSGFTPASLARTREVAATLPAADAVGYFRALGVASLVLPLTTLADPAAMTAGLQAAGATVRVQDQALVADLR